MKAGEQQECPVSACHRRLVDLHEFWHQLEEAYMDPATFRRTLNVLVPELRNISFLIQKQKHNLAEYDEWYPRWQNSAASDPVMRWVVKTRNRVVKEGDLELASTLRLRYQSVQHHHVSQELPEPPPGLSTDQVLTFLLHRGHLPREGLLTVSRKWVDVELPNFELLGATAHAWRVCASLVLFAHGSDDTSLCFDSSDWTRDCVISSLAVKDRKCLSPLSEYHERCLDLSDLTTQRTKSVPIPATDAGTAEARERYGEFPARTLGDAIDSVPTLLKMARRILEVDQGLLTTVHYFRGKQQVDFTAVEFQNRLSVIRHMGQIADHICELSADSVAISSEIWTASYDKHQAGVFAEDRLDRGEALFIQAVRSDGTARLVTLPFWRDDNGVRRFGELQSGGRVPGLEPIRHAWGVRRWWALAHAPSVEGCL